MSSRISNNNIQNKENSLPTSNISSNINSSRTAYNKNNEKEDNIITNNSNNSSNNNLELQKKKQNYVEILNEQQKKYIELYNKYQRVNKEYLSNKNLLKELENKELSKKIIDNLNKNKNKEKIEHLGKLKVDIATLKKKMKEIKNYNELLNEYMNVYKERFCYLSDFLSVYIEDIMELDKLLMGHGLNIPGINYDSYSNKRIRYKMLVGNLLKEVKVFNKFEKELYDRIVKLKEYEEQSENNSYRNTIQKVNKKEE